MFVVCLGEYGTSFGIDKHPSCKVKNLVSHVMCDKVSFDQGECSCTLHFKNADGAWQLLQHFVCRDYKTSQRGNGAGEFTAGIMHTAYILVINLSNQELNLKNARIR